MSDPTGARAASAPSGALRFAFGALLVAAIAVAAYANTFENGFVQDDHYLITTNEDMKDLGAWPSVFTSDFFDTDDVTDGAPQIGYYRPVTRLSWMLDYAAWGADAGGFHRTSVLIHALATLALTVLLFLLSRSAPAAWLAGLIFAVHPAHTEAVNIITARSDVLAGAFIALTLLLHVASRQRAGGGVATIALRALAVLCLGAALGSKEVGMAGLLAVAGLELVDLRARWLLSRSLARRALIVAPYAALGVAYVLARAAVLDVVPLPNDLEAHGAWAFVYGVPVAFAHHLGVLVFPAELRLSYRVFLPEGIDGRWLLAVATCAGVALAALLAWRRRGGLVLLAIGLFVAGVAPALAITKIHIPGTATQLPLADRWLYVPSLAIGALVAAAVVALGPRRERLAALALAALAAAFFALTWVRGPVFASDLEMMAETAENLLSDDPGVLEGADGRAYHALTALGLRALELERFDEAAELLRRAVEVSGGSVRATNNLASLELRRGRPEAAVSLLREVLDRVGEREREAVFMNLAVGLERTGNDPDAARAYAEVLRTNSDNLDAAVGGAACLTRLGRADEARAVLAAAATRPTADQRVHFNLGNLCGPADCACGAPAMGRYLELTEDPTGHPRRERAESVLRACAAE